MDFETKKSQALELATQLMTDNNIGHWTLKVRAGTSYLAQTTFNKTIITLGKNFIIKSTKEEFVGTVYHEIAHALVGPGPGHGRVFKNKCYEISGDMKCGNTGHNVLAGKFLIECPNCGCKSSSNRSDIGKCKTCWQSRGIVSIVKRTVNPMELTLW